MGRPLLVIASFAVAIVLGAVAVGCGSQEPVADDAIVEALALEPSEDGSMYTIGGDPFCEVNDDLLNDADEVDAASGGDELDLVITDSDEEVGIQAVPPFDPACARKAERNLEEVE